MSKFSEYEQSSKELIQAEKMNEENNKSEGVLLLNLDIKDKGLEYKFGLEERLKSIVKTNDQVLLLNVDDRNIAK